LEKIERTTKLRDRFSFFRRTLQQSCVIIEIVWTSMAKRVPTNEELQDAVSGVLVEVCALELLPWP
jgi:hypothetical protein